MQVLGIKSFFLDWFIASVLIFLSLFFLVRNITVMDIQVTYGLHESCSTVLPAEELMYELQGVLGAGEHCEIVSPCVDWQELRCESTLSTSGIYDAFVLQNFMPNRVIDTLIESPGVHSIKNTSTIKYELTWVLFLMLYVFVLIESMAVLFALWRQRALKQVFTLSRGTKKDQLLKPAVFAVIWGVVVVMTGYVAFSLFDYPSVKDQGMMDTIFKSFYGILFLVVVAPLVEELTFRGVFLRFFIDRKRLLLGTVVVSLVFSVFHGFVEKSPGWQLYVSSIYFVGSVILCRLYITQKTLWSPIVFHSAYNSTMVVFYAILS